MYIQRVMARKGHQTLPSSKSAAGIVRRFASELQAPESVVRASMHYTTRQRAGVPERLTEDVENVLELYMSAR